VKSKPSSVESKPTLWILTGSVESKRPPSRVRHQGSRTYLPVEPLAIGATRDRLVPPC
jgi:hypothetical protein